MFENDRQVQTDVWLQNMCYFFSMKTSMNRYWLEHPNLLREQAMYKVWQIARLGVYATGNSNSYAGGIYPNNQHIHLKPRYALSEIQ